MAINSPIGPWWIERSTRERRLLSVMAALVSLVLGWLLIVWPLADATDSAKRRHSAAVDALALARARGPAPSAAGASLAAADLIAVLRAGAAEAGFPQAQIAPGASGSARVAIEAARPPALFGWIGRMDSQGVTVRSLNASVNPDRTLRVTLEASPR